jgi:hypothetical protein
MKKSFIIPVVFILVVVLVVVITDFIKAQNKLPDIKIAGHNGGENTNLNSSSCQPCSASSIIEQVSRIIESPQTQNFRAGRSVNLSDACKRYNCDKIIPICYTFCNEEAKKLEEDLLKEVGLHPKCENIALDARGKMSKKRLPNIIYIKTIERRTSV